MVKGTIRERKTKDGSSRFQAQMRTKKVKKSATFPNREDAELWVLIELSERNIAFNDSLISRKNPIPPSAMLHYPIPQEHIPAMPGIYFFWNDDEIVYIGKSCNLRSRLSYKNHHHLKKHYGISFILFDVGDQELKFIEAWYIGCHEPRLNFTRPSV